MRDGSRRCVAVTEIQGMEGDTVVRSDLFKFEQTGYEEGKIIGMLRPTGLRPKFMDRIEAADVRLPASIFGAGQQRRRF
jgi:pilus assembly protein CpaF